VVIFLGAQPVIAGTDDEAYRLSREIFEADNDFSRKLAQFGRSFGAHDFSVYDLDAPFPDVAHLAEKSGRTRGTAIIERAREEKLTLRETVLAFTQYQASPFTGSPETVASAVAEWFSSSAFDGLNVGFRTNEDLDRFVADVVPLLQKRGLFRTEYEHDTLRGHLGLPIPANRWAASS
jgi:alkanesulfonate monooxygenase SsuD/methylene tetrahydromethanopterin reductase-like flavin-dependent oxidoreductase (luciferase family)